MRTISHKVGRATGRATCFIDGFHVHAYDAYHAEDLHKNSCWELNCFLGAGVDSRVAGAGNVWWERPVGQFCLIPPGTSFWTKSKIGGKAVVGIWISLIPTGVAKLDRLIPSRRGYAVFDDPTGAAAGLVMEWKKALSGLSPTELVFARQHYAPPLMELLQNAIRCSEGHYRILSLPPSARAGIFVERLRHYARQHYMDSIRLVDMARHMSVSPSGLSHRYARMTGDTPASLVLRTRVEVAARLMERGYHPKDIVTRTGFCDLPHLTRTFKQWLGLTPGQFRRTHVKRRLNETITVLPGDAVEQKGKCSQTPWSEELHESAALLNVAYMRRRNLSPDEHVHPCWVLDAFLSPGMGFRTTLDGPVDRAHGPGWLRLYRPGQRYWEDDSRTHGRIVSYSLTFFVIRGSEFWQKFGEVGGVVTLWDAQGQVLGLIKTLRANYSRYWTNARSRGHVTFQHVLLQLLTSQRLRSKNGLIEFVVRPITTK